MFGRSSHDNSVPATQPPLRLQVMPEEFYGGKDPVVHYDKEDIVIEKKKTTQPSVKPSIAPSNLDRPGKHHTWLIVGASITFLLAISGISWYYITDAQRPQMDGLLLSDDPIDQSSDTNVAVPSGEEPNTESVATSTVPVVESVPTSTPSLSETFEFPRKVFSDSNDLDADSLTDMEEEVFGTDTGVYDTDSDGYYDGLEIVNLYNPRGIAPMKLIDSGLVSEYVNPTSQYRVYYPASWVAAAVDPNAQQVLFSSITGDYVEVRVSSKLNGETFVDWFGRVALGQIFTDLSKGKNRFGIDMYRRDDGAVAYYETETNVFVVLYHPNGTGAVPFRQAVRMIEESFRPSRVFTELPVQETLPSPMRSVTVDAIL